MLNLNFEKEFDTVICVFGIFFVADMELAVRELWRAVAPGDKFGNYDLGASLF
jgi:ubiquinone/menaquinone biosynthesis C-methylase UbiE